MSWCCENTYVFFIWPLFDHIFLFLFLKTTKKKQQQTNIQYLSGVHTIYSSCFAFNNIFSLFLWFYYRNVFGSVCNVFKRKKKRSNLNNCHKALIFIFHCFNSSFIYLHLDHTICFRLKDSHFKYRCLESKTFLSNFDKQKRKRKEKKWFDFF